MACLLAFGDCCPSFEPPQPAGDLDGEVLPLLPSGVA